MVVVRTKISLLITLLLICFVCYPQTKNQQFADTSFTLFSAYQKELKNYPFIQPIKSTLPDSVIIEENMVYASYNDREMHIDIYSPANLNEPKPAILFIHGGGWRSGNKSMDAPMAIEFAQKGYVAATVEYRLSTEAKYPAAVTDCRTAIRWIRKNATMLHIDPNKIATAGTSSGGQIAALLGAVNGTLLFVDSLFYPKISSDVQAVIDIDGILAFIHPESREGADSPGKPSSATLWFGYSKEERPDLWNEASALTHAGKTFPPILFINSQHPRFHAGRDDLISLLDSLGIYSEVHTLPDTPHTFWLFDPWFETTIRLMELFLDKQF